MLTRNQLVGVIVSGVIGGPAGVAIYSIVERKRREKCGAFNALLVPTDSKVEEVLATERRFVFIDDGTRPTNSNESNVDGPTVYVLSKADIDSLGLVLPEGHPQNHVVYIGHPANDRAHPDFSYYYPTTVFREEMSQYKFYELLRLLTSLGAIRICARARCHSRRRAEINTKFRSQFVNAIAGRVGGGSFKKDEICYEVNGLTPKNAQPEVPPGMLWFDSERSWRRVADDVQIRHAHNVNVELHCERGSDISVGLSGETVEFLNELGGEFETFESLHWSFTAEFAGGR